MKVHVCFSDSLLTQSKHPLWDLETKLWSSLKLLSYFFLFTVTFTEIQIYTQNSSISLLVFRTLTHLNTASILTILLK